jgi:hypothetical protein
MIITSVRAMRPWTVEVSREDATFNGVSHIDDHTAVRGLPRVWPGHGLGLHEGDLAGFTAALAEVMKTPAYWQARSRHGAGGLTGRGGAEDWSVPHRDADDDFVYLLGPGEYRAAEIGFRPAATFTVALPDVRGLRIRLTAYLLAVTPRR